MRPMMAWKTLRILDNMKILNLYAGIGGNRKLWAQSHKITAVEIEPEIASVYSQLYPDDEVIVSDAEVYVEQHFNEFDFIWSSPPCPSHSQYRHNVGVLGKGYKPIIPQMTSLYGLITFLKTYFEGKYVVESVKPYYAPLIAPTFKLSRHIFWANFCVDEIKTQPSKIRTKNKISDFDDYEVVAASSIKNKRQALRNCVQADVGRQILDCSNKKQAIYKQSSLKFGN